MLAILACGLAACVPASSPGPRTPRATLGIAKPPSASAASSRFEVVFAGPRGYTPAESEINLVFSRPVRALGTAEKTMDLPIQITPALKGHWQWIGTQAVVFVPEGNRLPSATEIKVSVSGELTSIDGQRLGKPYDLVLETPRPGVVNVTTEKPNDGLVPESTWQIFLDQPVDRDELNKHLTLTFGEVGRQRRAEFSLTPVPKEPESRAYRLTPTRPLLLDTPIRLEVLMGLRGKEGPLPSTETYSYGYRTYGPLTVRSVECDRDDSGACNPLGSLWVELSNPVVARNARHKVRVSGAEPSVSRWVGDDEEIQSLNLEGRFRAGSTANVEFGAGLIDIYGQPLRGAKSWPVRFHDLPRRAALGVEGDLLEAAVRPRLPVGSMNVPEYELVTAPLPLDKLARMASVRDEEELLRLTKNLPGARREMHRTGSPRNQLSVYDVTLNPPQGGSHGLFSVVLGYQGRSYDGQATEETDTSLLARTDLALTAQLGRHGSVVWVTQLASAQPVSGAKVRVMYPDGRDSPQFLTDAQGMVRLPAEAVRAQSMRNPYEQQAVLVAEKDGDVVFRRVSDLVAEWRIQAPVDPAGELRTVALLFAERGIYRPGETVHVKALLRQERLRDLATVPGRELTLRLTDPQGSRLADTKVKTSEFGTAAAQFRLPKSARLGFFSVRAFEGKKQLTSLSFRVAEYRPQALKVEVTPERPVALRGGKLSVSVRASTLFGMKSAHADRQLQVRRERTSFTVPGSDGFVTDAEVFYWDREEQSPSSSTLLEEKGKLDEQGHSLVALPLALPDARGPERVIVEAEVTDATRNPAAAEASVLVHPAELYVGIKPPSTSLLTAPRLQAFQVATFDWSGNRKKGSPVTLELLRRRYLTVTEKNDGTLTRISRPTDETLAQCTTVTDDKKEASCSLRIPEAGSYFVRASTSDSGRRRVEAAIEIYAFGDGNPGWKESDDRIIELVADKEYYQVGDVAQVLVKSPFPETSALVTVGRSDIHSAERQVLKGHSPVLRIPIREDMRPNTYVAVQMVRPRTLALPQNPEAEDPGAPDYRMGWVELRVNPEPQRLKVELSPGQRQTAPGASVPIAARVTDSQGRPRRAEVTLWAVDEGVLSLTGYQVPDPIRTFLGSRPLQFLPMESREGLARLTLRSLRQELGLTKGEPGGGGGEDASGAPVRKDFRSTAFFLPHLVTDADGRVQATLKLPDGLTTYRVLAVATGTDDRFGMGSDRITTSLPLLAQPMLPRFLRVGDQAQAGVVVYARDVGPAPVQARLTAPGLASGTLLQQATVERGGSVELRFPLQARNIGTNSLRFDISAAGYQDALSVTRPVLLPSPEEVVALGGETQGQVTEAIGDLSQVRRDLGRLEVTASSSALSGAMGGFEQLIGYPYECSEQLASRLMALVPFAELGRAYGAPVPAQAKTLTESTVASLLRRQLPEGGFGMWPGAGRASSWVSPYVLWALHEYAVRGGAIPKDVFERGREYLRREVDRAMASSPTGLAVCPLALDVLALLGSPDFGYMSRVYEQRDKLPEFARALLLDTYARTQHDAAATETLVKEVERTIRLDGAVARITTNVSDAYAPLMDTSTRTTALTLMALLRARPQHPLAAPLVRGLLAERRAGQWATTQEAAFALMAVDVYRSARESRPPNLLARVFLGERSLLSERLVGNEKRSAQAKVPLAELDPKQTLVSLQADGEGTLFYEARLYYVPKEMPKDPVDAGFSLRRAARTVDEAKLGELGRASLEQDQTVFPVGSLVVVDLVVVAPRPRDHVVIDDPLPAGFEAVDTELLTTASWLRRGLEQNPESDERPEVDLPHRELRDDRVTFFVDHMPQGLHYFRYLARASVPGRFGTPPSLVQAMYLPEVFGRTGANQVTIE